MGVSMRVTVKAVQYVYGTAALSGAQIRNWFRQFQNGRQTVVDLPRRAKERTGHTAANIAKVKALLEQDNRHSISNLTYTTGIPWSTCRKIVRWDLHMSRRAAKFVPHLLKEPEMQDRLQVSTLMLNRLCEDPDFLESVITMDESWMYCYLPEMKCQSTAWLVKGAPRPMKVACPRAVGKLLLVSFFDWKGVVHHEYLRRTLNTELFLNILSNLRHAISRKRGQKYLKTFTLHMDNTSPHTSFDTRKFLLQSRTKVLLHPPYSPDLAPSDFWFYPRLKRPLRGRRFPNLQALQEAVDQEIGNIASFEFEQCITRTWPKRWARCVDKEGMYFEGLQ